jgi:hypothetical protein
MPGEEADANAYEQLKLIELGSKSEYVFADQLHFCGGIGAFGLDGLYWSPNSRYFYYTNAARGVPDGLCGYWARPIHVADVETRATRFVGSGHASPDGTMLAFWEDNAIVVWSLDKGEVARLAAVVSAPFPNEIAWSPDSRALVYLQTTGNCISSGTSYVTHLEVTGLQQTLILQSEIPSFTWLAWEVPDSLNLIDNQGKRWELNLTSRELQQVPDD